MPYVSQYVLPDVFLKYKGVTVYHTYNDGEFNEPSQNYFCTNIDDADEDENETQFDVRELPGFKVSYPPTGKGKNDKKNAALWEKFRTEEVEKKGMITAIKHAIENNLLKT